MEIDHKIYEFLYEIPSAIVYLKKRYQTTQVWKYCIEREPSVFALMENPSQEMCEYAVDIDGENIITVVTKFPSIDVTKRMAYIALRTYPSAILYIPENVLNEEMFDIAFSEKPSLMSYFTNLPFGYYLKKVRENPSIIQYIQNPTEDLICDALSRDPNLCVHFNHLTPRMINIIRELKPDMANLYINRIESEKSNAKNNEEEGQEPVEDWKNPY